ncbi:hypothetical protein [Halosimplex sp. TS25]|uniref:hypothetical protein n=1 Tax=Halosimplex rarum TaxID=3396619 RepID=UPI0039EA5C9F
MGERRTTEDPRDDADESRGDVGAGRSATAARRVETDAMGSNAASDRDGQWWTASGARQTWDRPESEAVIDENGSAPGEGNAAIDERDAATDEREAPNDEDDAGRDGDWGSAVRGAIGRAVDRVTTVEAWTPLSQLDGDARPIRRVLRSDESLQLVAAGELLGNNGGPATAGLTDDRLVVATDDGLVSVGFDRLCAVRSSVDAAFGVRGSDARVLGGLGYGLSVVAFLGVLAVASNPLTPALALATVGGVLAFDHVRREGLAVNGTTLTDRLRRFGPAGSLADALSGIERRLRGRASDDPLALWAAGAVALAPFAALVGLEAGPLAPLFALAIAGSFALVVRAVRRSDEFDGLEVVRTRRRTVVATVDDGSAVAVRTRPDSPLGRELAARADGSGARSASSSGD